MSGHRDSVWEDIFSQPSGQRPKYVNTIVRSNHAFWGHRGLASSNSGWSVDVQYCLSDLFPGPAWRGLRVSKEGLSKGRGGRFLCWKHGHQLCTTVVLLKGKKHHPGVKDKMCTSGHNLGCQGREEKRINLPNLGTNE